MQVMENQTDVSATQASQGLDKQPTARPIAPVLLASPPVIPRKAALLIACKYKGHEHFGELLQTHDDVSKLENLLIGKYRYDKSSVIVLADDNEHLPPTRANIVSKMKQLVEGARAGDRLFFHYSGHGDQTPCQFPGEEDDNMDEAIVPCDATDDEKTWIIDNELKELLVRKIPVNAQLIAFFDMCHSGTALDLKHYCYNERGTVHHYKRTSHDIIEDESRSIREVSSCQRSTDGQHTSAPHATSTEEPRQFKCTKRKSTLRYELSGGSVPSTCTISHVENGEIKSEARLAKHGKYDAVREELALQKKAIFSNNWPLAHAEEQRKQRSGSSPPIIARRYTYPCSCRQYYRYFRSLRRDFIRRSFKRKTSVSGQVANDEKADGAEPNLSMSALTATSPTLLNPSANNLVTSVPTSEPTAPVSTPAILNSPRPLWASLSSSGTSTAVSEFVPVRNDAAVPRLASEHIVEIPRCMSPVSEIPNNTASEALGSTSSIADAVIATAAIMTPDMPKRLRTKASGKPWLIRRKCKCTSASGDRECGQTISLASSSDDQIAWETREGSLTSALVAILEKEPHPTYESLLASVQLYLNNMSDEMRRDFTRVKKHRAFANRRAKVRRRNIPRQNQGKSRKDEGAAMLMATLEQANGGPVQTAIIGSQNYMSLATTRFDP